MLLYPKFNPIAFNLGLIKVHWYGLMYLISFMAAWCLANWRARQPSSGWSREQVGDFIFYAAIGVIVGGRLGYMIFYNLSDFITHPWIFFQVWDGGMSFHGGLIGVGLASWVLSRRFKKKWMDVVDFAAPLVPIGLAAGRLGNFINGELWGRVTNVPWAMVFPNAGPLPRHPSQLYEFLLEGVVLFIILWVFSSKRRPRFAVASLFLIGYGVFRFTAEFFRQPDPQLGYIALGWMTMGQLLSLPMIMIGILGLFFAYRHKESLWLNTSF